MKTPRLFGYFIACTLTLIFSGCETYAPPPPPQIVTPFAEADLAPFREKGTAVVTGQAFLKTQGGDVKVGAGEEVALIPATAFMREAVACMETGIEPANYAQYRPKMNEVIRRTQADAEGNFEFTGVPAGSYILQVKIIWRVPSGGGMTMPTGGTVFKEITVADGERVRAMLTR